MRYIDLIEARLTFAPDDVFRTAENDELGVVYVYGDTAGNLHLGYPPPGRYGAKAVLWPKKKRIDMRGATHGNKVMPQAQHLLAGLAKVGVIDDTWTVEASSGVGRYRPGGGAEWEHIPEPMTQRPASQWTAPSSQLNRMARDLVFYHGTSSRDWALIRSKGLHPLFVGSNQQHGFDSRAKHSGNEKVLYLASTIQKAHDYAKTRCSDWNRRLKRADREYDDNMPIVLAVAIPDPLKLVSDDDAINELARRVARRLFTAKPAAEQQRIMHELSIQRGFEVRDPSIAQMLWRESDAGFAEVMARIPARAYRAWLASLKRYQQIGYRGVIPPRFISPVVTPDTRGGKRD